MVELEYETLVEIFNAGAINLKEKDMKKYAERYIEILDKNEVDLDELLEVAEDLDERAFCNQLNEYLGNDNDEEEEDY